MSRCERHVGKMLYENLKCDRKIKCEKITKN